LSNETNSSPNPTILVVDQVQVGQRLDVFLTDALPHYSRAFFKRLIEQEHVLVNAKPVAKSGHVLRLNDQIVVSFPVEPAPICLKSMENAPQVELIFEHPDFLIISKPAGLVVHAPHPDYHQITLVDWLTHYFSEISQVGAADRAGIVHRLDMHTSGLMIVPRNNFAHAQFTGMFKDRQISKTYLAIVKGAPAAQGSVDTSIVRHPTHRNKMTHVCQHEAHESWARRARASQTNYTVQEYFIETALVQAKPVTGRTHQIRVHLASIGHALIGDVVYGSKSSLIERHALHAAQLQFTYQGQQFSFESSLPADMQQLLEHYRNQMSLSAKL
jgi:23S rRNA pseudouridine1911/1915/1917 synthase